MLSIYPTNSLKGRLYYYICICLAYAMYIHLLFYKDRLHYSICLAYAIYLIFYKGRLHCGTCICYVYA
ncbi:uncharacterized protein K441DRAFT_145045 [Cenococcum geophilum 1.58]|uniref:uncharacterized protein n=1 Tax=Cenococcum geophilum 1.58 TaxID=794803 RepID=UPI00358F698D|nr:hypothetical protein K441DRAFT_145045 [Cenococcum geophilum 1.58]